MFNRLYVYYTLNSIITIYFSIISKISESNLTNRSGKLDQEVAKLVRTLEQKHETLLCDLETCWELRNLRREWTLQ